VWLRIVGVLAVKLRKKLPSMLCGAVLVHKMCGVVALFYFRNVQTNIADLVDLLVLLLNRLDEGLTCLMAILAHRIWCRTVDGIGWFFRILFHLLLWSIHKPLRLLMNFCFVLDRRRML
jgi:hypothetical protein